MNTSDSDSDLFLIQEEEAGERLDKILASRYQGQYSRTYFQYLIDQNLVLLNGESVKKRVKPSIGDEVEIEFAALPEINLQPENIPLDILYEDDWIIVVNKPSGMVTHPAPGHWQGTFVNALLYHCQSMQQNQESCRPGIVHRLDKETSGVLVAAKTLEAQKKLIEQFASREVYKEYLAICLGTPPDREIVTPIGRHPVHRKKMAVVETGKKAISLCENLGHNGKLGIARVVIKTGRTHQIRVHLQHVGNPILGDSLYGNASSNQHYKARRQLLHAHLLQFKHPVTEEPLVFEAKLPEDIAEYYGRLIGKS